MKKIAFSVLLMLTGCMAMGCQAVEQKGTENRTTENIVLEVYTEYDEQENMQLLKSAFEEKHENIRISINPIPDSEYIKQMMKIKNEEENADCIFFQDIGEANLWREKGILLDLTQWYKKSPMFTFYQNWYTDRESEDGYYLIPYRTGKTCVYYNKALFEEFGVAYPNEGWTWEEFKQTAFSLTGWGERDKVYGALGFGTEGGGWTFPARTQGAENPFSEEDLEKFKEAAMWSLQFSDEFSEQFPYFAQTDVEESYYTTLFLEGRLAMLLADDSEITYLNRMIEEMGSTLTYDVVTLPGWQEMEPQPIIHTATAGISENSRYPNEAYVFLEFCTGQEGAKILAENGVVPALQSEEVCEIYTKAVPIPEHRGYFLNGAVQKERIIEPLYQGGWEVMQNQIIRYFSKQQELEQTFELIKEELGELNTLSFE